MIASVPPMIALGRFRCGSFTSPPTRDRSPNPSYAHSTLTSARPKFPTVMVAPIAGVRWANVPPCRPPSSSDAKMIAPRAANFTTVDTLTIVAPTLAPMMLAEAAKAMDPAASDRAALACATGSIPSDRRQYSPKTMEIPPSAAARMTTSSAQPNRNAVGRPQPSRR